MVNQQASVLDATFQALADPTRRAILQRLARGSATVSELAEPFDVSLPAISKHLRVLERAGLLTRRRDGRIHRIGLEAGPLHGASAWIERYRGFWEERLDALARYLEHIEPEEEQAWQRPSPPPTPRSGWSGPSKPPRKRSTKHGPGRS